METQEVSEDIWLYPHSVPAPNGYQLPKDFPYCCDGHKNMYERAQRCLDRFPDCCSEHRKLAKIPGFNIKNYEGVAIDIVKKSVYTEWHLCKAIEKEDWYRDITNYIEFIVISLGSYTVGAQIYYERITGFIETHRRELDEYKAQKLLDYINVTSKPEREVAKPIDLLIMRDIYNKWLNIFPFDLSLFSGLKELFTDNLPLFSGEPVYNPYTNGYRAEVFTQKGLIQFLVAITGRILLAIKSTELTKDSEGLHKRKLELINKRHQVKQAKLLMDFSEGEIQYVKIVKRWLKSEKEHIDEVRNELLIYQQLSSLPTIASDEPKPENMFNRMPIEDVKKWFIRLSNRISSNGKPHLTEEQVSLFIKRAFLGKSDLPKLHINYSSKEKLTVWKLFYQYYQHCTSFEAGIERSVQCREKYISLLTDNFDNFVFEDVKANFAKSNKVSNEW